MNEIGRSLVIFGLFLVIIGLLITFTPKGLSIPRLPGDIYIKRDGFTFYFPLTTCILVSIVLSLILYFLRK